MTITIAGSAPRSALASLDLGRSIMTGGYRGNNSQPSDGVATGVNTRRRHRAPAGAGVVRLRYYNGINGTANANPITLRAGIELGSQFLPVYFNGSRSITIPGGGWVDSDIVDLGIAAGTTCYSRTYVTVNAGEVFPTWSPANSVGSFGEGVTSGTTETDKTTSGTITGTTEYGFWPIAIIGVDQVAATGRCVGIVGDSIMAVDNSLVMRAFNDQVPFVACPLVGEQVQLFAQKGVHQIRKSIVAPATSIICDYGVNDLRSQGGNRSFANVADDLLALAGNYSRRGIPFWQTTIGPCSSSTDGFATISNQTPNTNDAARQSLNAWLRDGAPVNSTTLVRVATGTSGALRAGALGHPFGGVFDVVTAGGWEPQTGVWEPNLNSGDGLHPSSAGHSSGASGIIVASLK